MNKQASKHNHMQNVSGKAMDDDAGCETGGGSRARGVSAWVQCMHTCVCVNEREWVKEGRRVTASVAATGGTVSVGASDWRAGDTPDFQNRRSEAVRHYACNDLAASDERNQKR